MIDLNYRGHNLIETPSGYFECLTCNILIDYSEYFINRYLYYNGNGNGYKYVPNLNCNEQIIKNIIV